MSANDFQYNLKTLKETILDEQRLVTYITLSKELCVHVNEAKLLLAKAVEDIRNKQPKVELNVTYIVSGLSETHNGKTTVCSETELDRIKKTFVTIFFLHIYSLSKGLPSLDKVSLLATNKIEDLPLCIGLIKNDLCCKYNLYEKKTTIKLDSKAAISVLNQPSNGKKHSNSLKIIKKQENEIIKTNESIPEINIKNDITSPKNTSKGNQLSNKNGGNASNSIAGFFTKQNRVNKLHVKINQVDVRENLIKKEIELELKIDKDNTNMESKIKEPIQNKHRLENQIESDIKKGAKVNKKRKRLLHISDSDSDSERNDPFIKKENTDSEDEIPPTPDISIKITSGIVNPKKRRKMIDKTYVDDEGYILTHKEEVYETCSENEEEICKKESGKNEMKAKNEISPKEKKVKKKKKSPQSPQKGKQPTMMNFFKKI